MFFVELFSQVTLVPNSDLIAFYLMYRFDVVGPNWHSNTNITIHFIRSCVKAHSAATKINHTINSVMHRIINFERN